MDVKSSRPCSTRASERRIPKDGNVRRTTGNFSSAPPAHAAIPDTVPITVSQRAARLHANSPDGVNGDQPYSGNAAASSISETMSCSSSSDRSETYTKRKRSEDSPLPDDEESYVRRRERNNIAVRKSRAKKREEIQQFAEEQEKLQEEVDLIRLQNGRLESLLNEVEDGLLNDTKTKSELTAIMHRAKVHLGH